MYILVIEDNPDLVANLYDYFEARGHVPDVSYDGRSGIEFANRNSYDVIILDLMLPDMDGMEVCARLRESGHDLPILILTARDTLQDKLDGFDCGADDYLIKPFALQELEVRLSALVRRGSAPAPGNSCALAICSSIRLRLISNAPETALNSRRSPSKSLNF